MIHHLKIRRKRSLFGAKRPQHLLSANRAFRVATADTLMKYRNSPMVAPYCILSFSQTVSNACKNLIIDIASIRSIIRSYISVCTLNAHLAKFLATWSSSFDKLPEISIIIIWKHPTPFIDRPNYIPVLCDLPVTLLVRSVWDTNQSVITSGCTLCWVYYQLFRNWCLLRLMVPFCMFSAFRDGRLPRGQLLLWHTVQCLHLLLHVSSEP